MTVRAAVFFAKFALAAIQSGCTCTIDLPFSEENATIRRKRGAGGSRDSFFIVRYRLRFFSIGSAQDMRDEYAHSPRCTKVTWPLLARVGACKRFLDVLAKSRPVLSRTSRPIVVHEVTDKIETCLISRSSLERERKLSRRYEI